MTSLNGNGRELDLSPGHDRTSFSTSCLPMKPVAPVMKTDLPLKNSPMALVSILADMLVRSEEVQRMKLSESNVLFLFRHRHIDPTST